jgi:hypothetical protein
MGMTYRINKPTGSGPNFNQQVTSIFQNTLDATEGGGGVASIFGRATASGALQQDVRNFEDTLFTLAGETRESMTEKGSGASFVSGIKGGIGLIRSLAEGLGQGLQTEEGEAPTLFTSNSV